LDNYHQEEIDKKKSNIKSSFIDDFKSNTKSKKNAKTFSNSPDNSINILIKTKLIESKNNIKYLNLRIFEIIDLTVIF
jgi:hypothetical protein